MSLANNKIYKDSVERLYDNHRRFVGVLMHFDSGIIIGVNNVGTFCCRFDGQSTFELPSGEWYCNGNSVREYVLKSFVEERHWASGSAVSGSN